jgi:hypothetical protein
MGANKGKAKPSKAKRPHVVGDKIYSTFDRNENSNITFGPPFVVELCQGILSNVYLRMNIYLIGILVFSFLGDFLQDYQQYIYTARPDNVFNTYFVKFGWGWTSGLVISSAVLVGFTYDGVRGALWSVARTAIATGIWYGFTTSFVLIRAKLAPNFDASGHVFILVWSNLYMIEESKMYSGWDHLVGLAFDGEYFKVAPGSFLSHVQRCLKLMTLPVRLLLILQALLSILWDVMLFSSVLFYHTWAEKLFAVALAVFVWLVLYSGLYFLPLSPGSPQTQAAKAVARLQAERER